MENNVCMKMKWHFRKWNSGIKTEIGANRRRKCNKIDAGKKIFKGLNFRLN